VASVGGAATVLGLAIVPPLLLMVMTLRWNHPVRAVRVRSALGG
jgi:hypothetical protein